MRIAPRKPPFKIIFEQHELNSSANKRLKINSLSDINEKLLKCLSIHDSKQLDSVVFYKVEENDPSVLNNTDCIRIDNKLHETQ